MKLTQLRNTTKVITTLTTNMADLVTQTHTGRSLMKQYMPMTPTRRGFIVWLRDIAGDRRGYQQRYWSWGVCCATADTVSQC